MSKPNRKYPMHRWANMVSASRGGLGAGRVFVVLTMMGAMATIAATMPGCGKAKRDRAVVTGKVTYNGEPLRFGTVIFEPGSGQFATGAIQPDGTFQMETRGEGEGAPVGKCKVRFVCSSNQDPSAQAAAAKTGRMQGEGLSMGRSLIPKKYLSSATSGITVDVKPGDNKPLVFELTDH